MKRFKKTNRKQLSIRYQFFTKSLLTNCLLLLIPIMMIGPYSVIQSSKDNTTAIEKSTYQTLHQLEKTIELLYSQIDNAKIFFSSNPRVTIQMKKAFNEKHLSLDSLKNIENLSLYFQNLIFTDPYIENIYVYYDNTNNRIFLPQKGRIQTINSSEELSFKETYENSGKKDFWMEIKQKKIPGSTASTDALIIYQRLYTRFASKPSGMIAFEYNLNKMEQYFQTLLLYSNQTIYLIDSEGHIIYTNSKSDDSGSELTSIYTTLTAKKEQHLFDMQLNGMYHKTAYLKSARNNGLTYITFTPSNEIYKSTRSLTGTYMLLMFSGIFLSFVLAFFKTNKEYRYLNSIIDIFSNPEASQQHFDQMPKKGGNPFEYIMLNIIKLFLEQKYLKIQASERDYKMQILKMQALQHQINPHFLHNTLNTIFWEAIRLTSSENSCSTMISNLSSVMRYSLGDHQENVKIKEELGYLKTYLDIMKIRYTDKFEILYMVDDSCTIYPIKKMILQPIVENSIYHGIKEKKGKGHIYVGIRRIRKSILFYILDDGVGIAPEKLLKLQEKLYVHSAISSSHIGLTNTNLRLTMTYGSKSRLRLKSISGKYTLVYFMIPVTDLYA
ncbi:MAG: integral rane sensor signal transduction histidine kinase [Lacrimispora sp.]|nr:integral rane sensor signal transduction histidine kinase [Lacrimispora sp.]